MNKIDNVAVVSLAGDQGVDGDSQLTREAVAMDVRSDAFQPGEVCEKIRNLFPIDNRTSEWPES